MMRVLPLFILLMFGGCYDSLTKADLCNPRFEDCSQYESNSSGTTRISPEGGEVAVGGAEVGEEGSGDEWNNDPAEEKPPVEEEGIGDTIDDPADETTNPEHGDDGGDDAEETTPPPEPDTCLDWSEVGEGCILDTCGDLGEACLEDPDCQSTLFCFMQTCEGCCAYDLDCLFNYCAIAMSQCGGASPILQGLLMCISQNCS